MLPTGRRWKPVQCARQGQAGRATAGRWVLVWASEPHLQAPQRHHAAALIIKLGIPSVLCDEAIQPASRQEQASHEVFGRGGGASWVLAALMGCWATGTTQGAVY